MNLVCTVTTIAYKESRCIMAITSGATGEAIVLPHFRTPLWFFANGEYTVAVRVEPERATCAGASEAKRKWYSLERRMCAVVLWRGVSPQGTFEAVLLEQLDQHPAILKSIYNCFFDEKVVRPWPYRLSQFRHPWCVYSQLTKIMHWLSVETACVCTWI